MKPSIYQVPTLRVPTPFGYTFLISPWSTQPGAQSPLRGGHNKLATDVAQVCSTATACRYLAARRCAIASCPSHLTYKAIAD
ncbi:hypothetical protein FRC12_003431 [Ceratobasidium sp. 428]|nr:hypothetical protein FRC12_003431 [Ceratobasidium sp. 428]